eukprot:170336_1
MVSRNKGTNRCDLSRLITKFCDDKKSAVVNGIESIEQDYFDPKVPIYACQLIFGAIPGMCLIILKSKIENGRGITRKRAVVSHLEPHARHESMDDYTSYTDVKIDVSIKSKNTNIV